MDKVIKAPPEVDSSIVQAFADQQSKHEVIEVLKELFDKDKLQLISDLEPDEIKLITRILMISKMRDIESWDSGMMIFMSLLLSKKRRSRSEVIDAVRGYAQRMTGLQRLFGGRERRGMYP